VKRTHTPYLPEEEAWLILLHKKLKLVIEAGYNIRFLGPTSVMDSFNEFFLGKVLQGADGWEQPPREARDEISIKGKLYHVNSGIKPMRDVMRKLVEGKHGGTLYVPIITEDELKQYRENCTIAMDDPKDLEQNAALVHSSLKRKRGTRDADGSDGKRVKQTPRERGLGCPYQALPNLIGSVTDPGVSNYIV
jgi:hypothetical protein